jgi:hypothetical protein
MTVIRRKWWRQWLIPYFSFETLNINRVKYSLFLHTYWHNSVRSIFCIVFTQFCRTFEKRKFRIRGTLNAFSKSDKKIFYTHNSYYKMFCNFLPSSNKFRYPSYHHIFHLLPTRDNSDTRPDILKKKTTTKISKSYKNLKQTNIHKHCLVHNRYTH